LSIYGGIYAQDGYTNLDFSNNGTGGVIGRIGVRNNGGGSYLTFGTSNNYGSGITNEALVIGPSGNVGIGTTSPGVKLHVNGSVRGHSAGALKIDTGHGQLTIGPQNTGYAHFYTDRSLYYFNKGIDVSGNVRSNGTPLTSDIRWKENIEPLNDALDLVSQLRGVSYDWTDPSRGEGRQIGVIAQEVEQVLPEVVHTDSQGYKSVEYAKLVAPLIEAVKTLKHENESLKQALDEQVASLRAENEALKDSLNEILTRLGALEQ
jgi:hypothetical protein